jgi:hypothetical protein
MALLKEYLAKLTIFQTIMRKLNLILNEEIDEKSKRGDGRVRSTETFAPSFDMPGIIRTSLKSNRVPFDLLATDGNPREC